MTDKPTKSDWDKLAEKESRGKDLSRDTVEGIRLANVYGPDDAAGIDSDRRPHTCLAKRGVNFVINTIVADLI